MTVLIAGLLISVSFFCNGTVEAGAASFEDSLKTFPKAYHSGLKALHSKYPHWKFEPMNTGLKWTDVLAGEAGHGTSVIGSTANVLLKSQASGDYNPDKDTYVQRDSGYVSASESAVAYYMDPRNFLDEKYVFQFEKLTYTSSHTLKGVENVLKNTFMHDAKIEYYDTAGKKIKTDKKYSEVIMEAAKKANISAYYVASKIRQEIGAKPSGSVSGKYSGYEGYYNFYNIGATDGVGAIGRGLKWAKEGTTYNRPWNTPEKSITGGAEYIASMYIGRGQYTGYLQKFDINPASMSKPYTHQYMTNLSGAVSEGAMAYNGYVGLGTLSEAKTFSIPVSLLGTRNT